VPVVAPERPVQVPGVVTAASWGGAWLPTMKTVSAPALDWLSPFKKQAASSYVQAHQGDEAKALLALDPQVQNRLVKLQGELGDDSLANAGFVRFLLEGKLTAPQDGTTLLDELEGIAFGPLASTVDRHQLLTETMAELDQPGRITQGIKLTCEAASVEIMLLERHPAAFVHLVAQLAGHGGQAKLAGGDTVQRVRDWASHTDGWRSEPSRLIEPAFAVLGNAPLRYSNTEDKNEKGESGLTDEQLTKLCTAVFGVPFKVLTPTNSTPEERMAAFRAANAKGWQVPIWLNWFTGHVCLAESEADGRVVFDNPMGAIHSIDAAEFQKALHSVYVPVNP
jgi:hypothetical protein